MALNDLGLVQYELVYNMLSLGIASMGAATIYFFFQASWARPQYRDAILISSMVVLIAFYHYLRIFESFERAYDVSEIATAGAIVSGEPFNDAYRYVDWLLTVPLLLMELVMVMDLSSEQTNSLCMSLGGAAALMILL